MRRFFAAVLLIIPITVSANTAVLSYAGTDQYLREEYPSLDLSTKLVTEKREPFLLAEEEKSIKDPLGDVLTRYGTSSNMRYAWGDIESVETKENDDGSWVVQIKMAAPIPEVPTHAAQFLFLVDQDGDTTNNDVAGIHGNVDAEFVVKRTDGAWQTDFRWFNKEADFWGVDKNTSATFTREDNLLTLTIPAEELSHHLPKWRVVVALSEGNETQIDAVPGTGFPKPLPEFLPETPTPQKPSIALYGIPFILVGLGLVWFGWKRRT